MYTSVYFKLSFVRQRIHRIKISKRMYHTIFIEIISLMVSVRCYHAFRSRRQALCIRYWPIATRSTKLTKISSRPKSQRPDFQKTSDHACLFCSFNVEKKKGADFYRYKYQTVTLRFLNLRFLFCCGR